MSQSAITSTKLHSTAGLECPSCNMHAPYAVIPNRAVHIYCTKCTNVFYESQPIIDYSRILTNWGIRKTMNRIESKAPICACGGLFVFNAQPNCPNCNARLPMVQLKALSRNRLNYSDMIVFTGTRQYSDAGKDIIYTVTNE